MNEWRVKLIDLGYRLGRDVYIFRGLYNGKTEILGVGEFNAGEASPEPTIHLEPEQLQALSNALNDNGFKPQDGFIEGKLKATEYHLEDMRKLLKLKKQTY